MRYKCGVLCPLRDAAPCVSYWHALVIVVVVVKLLLPSRLRMVCHIVRFLPTPTIDTFSVHYPDAVVYMSATVTLDTAICCVGYAC